MRRTDTLNAALALFVLPLLSACYVRDQSGGYAAECERRSGSGWDAGNGRSLQFSTTAYSVDLSTRHLHDSTDPGLLIEVQAYTMKDPAAHRILLDPGTTSIEVDGKIVAAQPALRESPFMEPSWRCGGTPAAPADLNQCGPLVVTFPVAAPPGRGFVVRLGSLRIDGEVVPVPDLKYCYIPRRTKWLKFHG